MANLKSIPQEFIQSVFQPQIGILTSSKVTDIVQKNNLTFAELISPFSKLKNEASLRDHAGNTTPIKNLQLSIVNLQQNPLPTNIARKLLNYVVSTAPEQLTTTIHLPDPETVISIPVSTPWFENWRDTFLKVQYPSDHEFTRHILASMIIIASDETNMSATLENLNKTISDMQNVIPQKYPKFFSHNILRYYVVIHDKSQTTQSSGRETFERVKSIYGTDFCFLLEINSRNNETNEPAVTTNPWLPYINQYQYPDELELDTTGFQSPVDNNISSATSASSIVATHIEHESISEDAIIVDPIISTSEPELRPLDSTSVSFHPLSPSSECGIAGSSSDLMLNPDQMSDSDQLSNLTSSGNINLVYGALITSQDLEQLHRLIQDFCVKALIPYVENEIQRLTDIVANRKGVSRSLVNATRRWFVSTKPGTASTVAAPSKIYNSEESEVQLRKLADLYFMFGNYPMAYQAYSAAKRDFYSDTAWQYYAGALEMAALSSFLMGEFTKKNSDYMEEAVNIYLTTCRVPQFATRTTLLSAECLRGLQWWGEQAKQLIRMTSEDSDLRSALLLEQSAYCFLKCKPAMNRKYAFHIVLAGHRYSKAGQRKHNFRCYSQAAQVYHDRSWELAEDHINYTLGRQALNLQLVEQARDSFEKLLRSSQQSASQQTTYMKEFLSTCANSTPTDEQPMVRKFPIPVLCAADTKVALLPTAPLSAPERVPAASCVLQTNLTKTLTSDNFLKLEEMTVHEALTNLPIIFRPYSVVFTNETNNSVQPISIAGETIAVMLKFVNPLKVAVLMRDIRLVWRFTDTDGNEYANNDENIVHTVPCASLQVRTFQNTELTLYLTPMVGGELNITGVLYGLSVATPTPDDAVSNKLTGTERITLARIDFDLPPKKIQRKQSGKSNVLEDCRLKIKVVPEAPCLQVTFSHVDTEVLTGEMQHVRVEMMNSGNCSLTSLYFATSMPHLLYYDIADNADVNFDATKLISHFSTKEIHRKQFVRKVSSPEELESGRKFTFDLYIKAPNTKGNYMIDWIVYYQNSKNTPKYRLVKHFWELIVTESLTSNIQTATSELSNNNGTGLNISLKLTSPIQAVYLPARTIRPLEAFLVAKQWTLGDKRYMELSDSGLSIKETREYYLRAVRPAPTDNWKLSSVQLTTADKEMRKYDKALNYFIRNSVNKIVECDGDVESNIITPIVDAEDGVMSVLWSADVTDQLGVLRQAYGFIKFLMSKPPPPIEAEINTEPLGVFRFNKSQSALEEIARRKVSANLERRQKQIKYYVEFPKNIIEHDFNQSEFCTFSLNIYLINLVDQKLSGKIELLDQRLVAKKKWLHQWLGVTKTFECELEPYGSRCFSLQIAVTENGLFDISHFFETYSAEINSDSNIRKGKYVLQTYRSNETIVIVPPKEMGKI